MEETMTQKIALPTREEMDQEYCWKLEDIFDTDEDWMNEYKKLELELETVHSLKGTVAEGAQRLYKVLESVSRLEQSFERIYVYANQKYHQDTGNQKYQEMSGKAASLSARLSDALAFRNRKSWLRKKRFWRPGCRSMSRFAFIKDICRKLCGERSCTFG